MNYTLKLRLEGEFPLFNGSIHFNPIKYKVYVRQFLNVKEEIYLIFLFRKIFYLKYKILLKLFLNFNYNCVFNN